MSEERTAWGWGLASVDAAGTTLDVWYPELNLGCLLYTSDAADEL